jgi:hypothetical protein
MKIRYDDGNETHYEAVTVEIFDFDIVEETTQTKFSDITSSVCRHFKT